MAASIRKQWKEEGAHKQIGDRALVIVDLDNSESKAKEIRRLKNGNDIEEYIVSNPSFEVWYLLHFEYSTRSYIDAGAAIKELKKHHPGYEKTSDMYPFMKKKMGEAIANAEKLEAYYNVEEHLHPDVNCNPYTDVHKLVKKLLG